MYRKVQNFGLQTQYGNDEKVSMIVRQLVALAFLPPTEIPNAFLEFKYTIPSSNNSNSKLFQLFDYFDTTYVRGPIRRTVNVQGMTTVRENRSPPTFSPSLWSVHDRVELEIPRTQNKIEGWHHRFEVLVSGSHVGLFKIIKELQKEQKNTEKEIEDAMRGAERPKPSKQVQEREKRILNIFESRNTYTTAIDLLCAYAHNIHL